MEHEQMTYPDALRWIAKKYHIEIEEEVYSEEEDENRNIRESLLAVNSFALKTFSEWLWEDDLGRSIGLAYFRERGFTDETIKKFELGFHLEGRSNFSDVAIDAGYKPDVIEQTGLSIHREDGSYIDRFWGRVMFPIHSMSGRVIGFGGRTLKTKSKTAKYLNSPESQIYYKSKVLYGLFQAKKMIVRNDQCYLVEGYTDVISLFQQGIENVVSTSGTALTIEQIRLLKRLTRNITLLYDGDAAGIRASFRGIDLLLEEGMLVRVVPLPEGQDPDTLAKAMKPEGLLDYLETEELDFIQFKLESLIQVAADDPIQRAEMVRDIVQSISKIPDAILREVYIKDSAKRLEIEEKSLFLELNRIIDAGNRKTEKQRQELTLKDSMAVEKKTEIDTRPPSAEDTLMRILLLNGIDEVKIEIPDDDPFIGRAGEFILNELNFDQLEFVYPSYKIIYNTLKIAFDKDGKLLDANHFIRSNDTQVAAIVAELLVDKYVLADWGKKNIYIPKREDKLSNHVLESVFRFKEIKLKEMIFEKQLILDKTINEKERLAQLKDFNDLIAIRNSLFKKLNRIL
jgi:DNA primase